MISLTSYPYPPQDILDALHGKYGSRHIRFRYDLLDGNNRKIGELDRVLSGKVSMNALSTIKRTATFTLQDRGDINWLTDRIQPILLLKMPKTSDWIEFPLGVFLLVSPTRSDHNRNVYRDVGAFDGLLILKDDKFQSRYIVKKGVNYRAAILDILKSAGITQYNIEEVEKTIPNDIEYPPGTEKIKAINELLGAINFTPLHVDVFGYFTSRPYVSPVDRIVEFTYKDDDLSIVSAGMEEDLDLYSIPNRWVAVLSDPERDPLVSTYTNNSALSPTSTVNRSRIIVDYREVDEIADQESLDAYVQRIAFESSQIFGKLSFRTAINPLHDYFDVLRVEYSPLGINHTYSETGWEMPLEAGGLMKHNVRRIVSV
ncbi:hypothetical protein ACQCT5_10505 [Sutcliffiella halmapala]